MKRGDGGSKPDALRHISSPCQKITDDNRFSVAGPYRMNEAVSKADEQKEEDASRMSRFQFADLAGDIFSKAFLPFRQLLQHFIGTEKNLAFGCFHRCRVRIGGDLLCRFCLFKFKFFDAGVGEGKRNSTAKTKEQNGQNFNLFFYSEHKPL